MARPKLFTDKELRQMGGKPMQAPPPVGRIVRVKGSDMPPAAYLKTLIAGSRGYGPFAEKAVKELSKRLKELPYSRRMLTVDLINNVFDEIIEEIKEDVTMALDEYASKYSPWSTIAFKKGRPIS
jgi:hypothetical protein